MKHLRMKKEDTILPQMVVLISWISETKNLVVNAILYELHGCTVRQ